MMLPSNRTPAHPRDILADVYAVPSCLARHLPDVTAPIARELSAHFGTSPDYWLNLQANHDAGRSTSERPRHRWEITEIATNGSSMLRCVGCHRFLCLIPGQFPDMTAQCGVPELGQRIVFHGEAMKIDQVDFDTQSVRANPIDAVPGQLLTDPIPWGDVRLA